ncbi:MAG: CDP-glycerol glycerophosphotransferase family protein, partial [Selenomonadaceae bacterium]|nr:CDP-glycerol glycerophosphotransferase family protein [Selenomonadaceae bacterium]
AEYPTYTEFRFQKAELLIKQGQPLEAEKLLDEALREYENAPTGNDGKNLTDGSQQAYPAACVMMADICNMHLREEEAGAYHEKSLRQLPYQPRILKLWLHGLMDRCTEEEIIGKIDSIYSPEGDAAFLMSVLKELPLDRVGSYYARKIPETASLTEGIAIRPLSAFEKKLHCDDIAPLLEEARTEFPRVLDLTAWLTQEMGGFPLQEEVAGLALPQRWKEALRFKRGGGESTKRTQADAERIWENPFADMSEEECLSLAYRQIHGMSCFMKQDWYLDILEGLFRRTEEMLRHRENIKVGFVLYDASMWCGDELYRLFEQSERYEPTIYLCLRKDVRASRKIQADFQHSVEQLRLRGFSVVAVTQEQETSVEADVLFCLTPYHKVLPKQVNFMRMTPKTLLIHIPYGLSITAYDGTWKSELAELSWRQFLESEDILAWFRTQSEGDFRRGYVSGHPKMDALVTHGDEMHFEWKMVQPDAKRIIWAPHWSIQGGVAYATFQWNWQFFLDYAKVHPETAWIVKPHPNLLISAVSYGIFSSEKEFQDYLDAWDELPNAKVVTGAYYHEIFATSDAMILDSASFTAEYQYTGKPLLFLTRDTQKTNDFGHALMQQLYRADGKDHEGIRRFIEDVVLRGNDTMQPERQAFFREHLDYVSRNGKTASRFIFDEIEKSL